MVKAPVPVPDRAGRVRTYPSTSEGSAEHEALLSAIQQGINHKTAKGQMGNSPDQKWVAVILEGIAAQDLSDHFGAGSHPPPRLDSEIGDITFPYFDQVWAIAPQKKSLVVLHLWFSREGRASPSLDFQFRSLLGSSLAVCLDLFPADQCIGGLDGDPVLGDDLPVRTPRRVLKNESCGVRWLANYLV